MCICHPTLSTKLLNQGFVKNRLILSFIVFGRYQYIVKSILFFAYERVYPLQHPYALSPTISLCTIPYNILVHYPLQYPYALSWCIIPYNIFMHYPLQYPYSLSSTISLCTIPYNILMHYRLQYHYALSPTIFLRTIPYTILMHYIIFNWWFRPRTNIIHTTTSACYVSWRFNIYYT